MAEWQIFTDKFMGPVHPPEQSDQLYHCGGGVDSCSIGPSGEMSICVLSQKDQYSLRTGTVRDGWEHFLRRVRDKRVTRPTKCTSCELKAMCGMCPANGELENGDPEAPVDFLCRVAHLRAHAFGLSIPPHGDCEYCVGGTKHSELKAAAASLSRTRAAGVAATRSSGRLLPLTAATSASGCGSGACGSCGTKTT